MRAASIVAARKAEHEAEVSRLYRLYAQARSRQPHRLDQPKRLQEKEALLLVALERRHFTVEAESPNSNRWQGDATCSCGERDAAIVVLAASRLDVLWALWASVSNQHGDTVTFSEAHLQGNA